MKSLNHIAAILLALCLMSVQAFSQNLEWISLQEPRMEYRVGLSLASPDRQTMIVRTGDGSTYQPFSYFRSADQGKTWTYFTIDPSLEGTFLFVADRDGLAIMPKESGSTPIAVEGFTYIHPYEGYRALSSKGQWGATFVVCEGALIHTTNGGNTWRLHQDLWREGFQSFGSSADGRLYIKTQQAIWRLDSLEATWKRFAYKGHLPSSFAAASNGTLFFADHRVYVANLLDSSVYTVDSILTQSCREVVAGPSDALYFFGKGLFRTHDAGQSWDTILPLGGFDYDEFSFCFDSSGYLYVFDGFTNHKVGDNHSTYSQFGIPNHIVRTVKTLGDVVMVSNSYFNSNTRISFDRGITWRYMLPVNTRRITYPELNAHPSLGIWLLLYYHDVGKGQEVSRYHILHSKDGLYWTETDPIPHSGALSYLGQDSQGKLYFSEEGFGVTVSSADGLTFERIASPIGVDIASRRSMVEIGDSMYVGTRMGVAAFERGNPVAVTYDSMMYVTKLVADGAGNRLTLMADGSHFFTTSQGEKRTLPGLPEIYSYTINDAMFMQGRWYLATDTGLYCSSWIHGSDHDTVWSRCDSTLPDKQVNTVHYDGQDRLYVGTEHSGAYYAVLESSRVGYAQVFEEALQVYPNPASERLFVETAGRSYDFSIYDQLGRIRMSGVMDGEEPLDVSNLEAGYYILEVGGRQQKLLIQR